MSGHIINKQVESGTGKKKKIQVREEDEGVRLSDYREEKRRLEKRTV